MQWPTDRPELEELQTRLAACRPPELGSSTAQSVGGCFVCFRRGGTGTGDEGDPGWSAAVILEHGQLVHGAQAVGFAPAPYVPGALAAREGQLLSASVSRLPRMPDVLLVNATGADHPRRAGLAVQLGWVHDVATIGVTNRTLVATGEPPGPWRGSHSPLDIDGEHVGWWVRTRNRSRPVAVTPGWAIGLDAVVDLLLASVGDARTPEPLREARRLARSNRAGAASAATPG